jgi:hypothetical protein
MFRIIVPSNMRSRRTSNIPQLELITILSQVFISTQVCRTLTYSNLVLPIFIIYYLLDRNGQFLEFANSLVQYQRNGEFRPIGHFVANWPIRRFFMKLVIIALVF